MRMSHMRIFISEREKKLNSHEKTEHLGQSGCFLEGAPEEVRGGGKRAMIPLDKRKNIPPTRSGIIQKHHHN